MYKKLNLLAVLFALSMVSSAQNANDFQKQFNAFRQHVIKTYRDFREQCNYEYVEFIRKHWIQQEVLPPRVLPKEDKPIPPVFFTEEDRKRELEDKPLPYVVLIPTVEPIPQPQPVSPIEESPDPEETWFTFNFWGTEGKVRLDERHRFKMPDCKESSVAKAWEHCIDESYNNVVYDCLQLRVQHRLCDWAYLGMIQELTAAFLGRGTTEATLLASFIYCQSGYKMRMARSESKLHLLAASRHHLYGSTYFEIDGEKYFPFDDIGEEERLYICQASFPKEQPLSLMITDEPLLSMNPSETRKLQSDRYKEVQAEVTVNRNLIEFYNKYPTSEINGDFMTRWAMYANTPLAENIKEMLYPSLQEVIAPLSQCNAVNRILNFVQTAFVYEYDDKVWGDDRAFFAEETLFYPYCDCEDRSILFSRLVRDLLGLKVLLVYVPGHLFTAVHFTEEVSGKHIMLDGQKYIVCDPTYMGAPVGATMPDMDNGGTKVILLE